MAQFAFYQANGVTFTWWDGKNALVDPAGKNWTVTESQLAGHDGRLLGRVPAHHVFWFGWQNAYPESKLIH